MLLLGYVMAGVEQCSFGASGFCNAVCHLVIRKFDIKYSCDVFRFDLVSQKGDGCDAGFCLTAASGKGGKAVQTRILPQNSGKENDRRRPLFCWKHRRRNYGSFGPASPTGQCMRWHFLDRTRRSPGRYHTNSFRLPGKLRPHFWGMSKHARHIPFPAFPVDSSVCIPSRSSSS